MLCRVCQTVEVPGRECLDCQLELEHRLYRAGMNAYHALLAKCPEADLRRALKDGMADETARHAESVADLTSRYEEAEAYVR